MGKKWGIWLIAAVLGLSSSAVAGNRAVMVDENGVLRNPSANIFSDSNGFLRRQDIPFLFSSNCNWRIIPTVLDIRFAFGTNVVMRLAYGESDAPNVISISVDTNPPSMTLVFEASGESNRLETTTYATGWSTWDDCIWSYTNGTGTVVATEVDLGAPTFARIVSLSGVVTTNPYLHVSAPIYSGAKTSEATRVVTLAELSEVQYSKASKREVSSYTPLIHQLMTMGAQSIWTNMETGIITTNWMTPGDLYPVWNFDKETGLVYFKDSSISNLTLGGETRTNWPQGTILGATINEPNTVATNDGILAFTVTADGSGFPLTNDVSAAGFDLQGVGWFSAQNATISNNATVNNSFSVGGNAQIGGTLAVHDDMTVYGNLAVIGYSSNTQWHYLNVYTQINGGTFTNFITENRYTTNNVYLVTNIVNTTYTTQFIDYVSVVGSDVDYSLSANVMLPHLTDGTETNAVATGTWDYSGATVIGLLSDADGEAMRLDLTDGIHPRMTAVTNDSGAAFIWPASSSWWRVYATSSITGVVPVVDGVELSAADILLLGVEVYRDSEVDFSWGGGDSALAGVTNDVPAGATSLHMLWRASGTTTWAGF